MLIIYGLL